MEMAESGPAMKKARRLADGERTADATPKPAADAEEDDAAAAGLVPRAHRDGLATGRVAVVARKHEAYDDRAAHWAAFAMTIEDMNSVRESWKKMSMTERGNNDMSFQQMKTAVTLYVRRKGEVAYAYGKNHATVEAGRLCAMDSASLQCFPREVRALIAGGKYRDVDAVNAQPTLLEQLCARYGWACPHTQHYLANREEILKSLMTLRGWMRDEAKQAATGVFSECPPRT